jgi:hypothetical protein
VSLQSGLLEQRLYLLLGTQLAAEIRKCGCRSQCTEFNIQVSVMMMMMMMLSGWLQNANYYTPIIVNYRKLQCHYSNVSLEIHFSRSSTWLFTEHHHPRKTLQRKISLCSEREIFIGTPRDYVAAKINNWPSHSRSSSNSSELSSVIKTLQLKNIQIGFPRPRSKTLMMPSV